jgi:hypothetical protein
VLHPCYSSTAFALTLTGAAKITVPPVFPFIFAYILITVRKSDAIEPY